MMVRMIKTFLTFFRRPPPADPAHRLLGSVQKKAGSISLRKFGFRHPQRGEEILYTGEILWPSGAYRLPCRASGLDPIWGWITILPWSFGILGNPRIIGAWQSGSIENLCFTTPQVFFFNLNLTV